MRPGRGVEARRAGRIHVTLAKDLRQTLSCLARLTKHRSLRVNRQEKGMNRKRKRRAASSSSSSLEVSDDPSSEVEEQTLKPPRLLKNHLLQARSISEDKYTSSSESESDSEASNSPVKQQLLSPQPSPKLHSKTRHLRASPSPSPPLATLPSFISTEDDGDSQRNKEMQEKFRMASVADGFREGLEVIQKEPNMKTTKFAMLIDSSASGAYVFTSPGSKNGVNEIGVALE
ncbi:hypothetical protein JOM56_012024 [Amanita muscaria]